MLYMINLLKIIYDKYIEYYIRQNRERNRTCKPEFGDTIVLFFMLHFTFHHTSIFKHN